MAIMMKLVLSLTIVVIWNYKNLVNADEAPCYFANSVNITNGRKLKNGSVSYNGVTYPQELTHIYDYSYKDKINRQVEEPHLRGCICRLKTCVRMCCDKLYYLNQTTSICQKMSNYLNKTIYKTLPQDFNYTVDIIDSFNKKKTVNIYDQFGVVNGYPCAPKDAYFILPRLEPADSWNLTTNGKIILDGGEELPHENYCMSPVFVDDEIGFEMNPLLCYSTVENDIPMLQRIHGIASIFSLPFMVITLLIYIIIPELRNLHGKCLVSFLVSLSVTLTLMAMMKLHRTWTPPVCKIFGYTTYFACITIFFWLNVMSFDLWWNIRTATGAFNRKKDKKKFLLYSLYSWGCGAIYLSIAYIVQNSDSVPLHLKSGIAEDNFCFIDPTRNIQWFYLFGPILVVVLLNCAMFISTTLKIRTVQRELSRMTSNENSRRHFDSEKTKFGLFLRLFIIMGITWSMETLSWNLTDTWVPYIADFLNAIQGFIIFVLFVLRKKVLKLILKSKNSSGSKMTRTTVTAGRIASIKPKKTASSVRWDSSMTWPRRNRNNVSLQRSLRELLPKSHDTIPAEDVIQKQPASHPDKQPIQSSYPLTKLNSL